MVKLPHWPIPSERSKINYGPHKLHSLLEALGNPHLKLPPVIHVAGTNGKGSTIAFMRSIFEAAGYKVHSYISPHLIKFNERINLYGEEISDSFLFEVIEECRIAASTIDTEYTFFEGTTAAAFLAFSKIPADILLLETGLGGRLDATNVIENPLLTVITSISYDHMQYLGHHISQIAFEKAGIMKTAVPCIVSQQYPEVIQVLDTKAQEIKTELIAFEYDWMVEKTESGLLYQYLGKNFYFPPPSLIGDHQYVNVGNAITATLNAKHFHISDAAIIQGITNAYWPARLQKLVHGIIINNIPKNWEVWVDGAHNPAGAHVLSLWVKENNLPIYLIFGTTRGRDCKEFLLYFKNIVKHIMAVTIDAEPLSYDAKYIADIANKIAIPTTACNSIEEAFSNIVGREQEKAIILVCGSLYLAGDVLYKNQKTRKT